MFALQKIALTFCIYKVNQKACLACKEKTNIVKVLQLIFQNYMLNELCAIKQAIKRDIKLDEVSKTVETHRKVAEVNTRDAATGDKLARHKLEWYSIILFAVYLPSG